MHLHIACLIEGMVYEDSASPHISSGMRLNMSSLILKISKHITGQLKPLRYLLSVVVHFKYSPVSN